ncbi:MAG: hypothetical protein KGL59_01280 [Acidobacteriota bacterium]|nr:hypothetical protein [Acidobacteriota bacterium]
MHYRLYGMDMASDRTLTGLDPSDAPREPDVVCRLGQLPTGFDAANLQQQKPTYSSRILDAQGVPILRVWHDSSSQLYCFQYCEGLTFLIDEDGARIWARWVDGITEELVTAFFLSQVLAFVLHLRGCICFHASSVVIEGRAVLFAGNPGRGKSSTAAAFAERGCPVLADDVSVLRSDPGTGLLALPGPPRVCLWPDSAEFVYGADAAEQLPEFVPWENKRLVRLGRSPGKYQDEPAPLGAVYLLAPRSDDPGAPSIEPLDQTGGLLELLVNGFVSSALASEHRGREFQLQAEVARTALVRRLVPSSDPNKLGQLCELVINDVHAANAAVSGRSH